MKTLIIASIKKNAGKTSIIAGLAKTMGKGFTYLKPFGDRLYFRKKVLWDYDAVMMTSVFGINENPEYLSIGFNHRKIRYLYDEASMKDKLHSMITEVSGGKEIVFIECGEDLACGAWAYLDALSIARYAGGSLIFIVSGDDETIMDDLTFLGRGIRLPEGMLRGVILNKVENLDEFRETYAADIRETGVDILGMVPYRAELTCLTGRVIAERLFAKVVGGEQGLDKPARGIFIGAMTTQALLENLVFKKERDKLVITTGDRTDLIMAAMERDTSCVVLACNIMPAPQVISRADEKGIPLILVAEDAFPTARHIEELVPTITPHDPGKTDLLADLVKTHIDLGKL